MRTYVTLSKEEMKFAGELGRLRTEENKNRRDIPDYKPGAFNLTNLQNNRVAVAAEMSVVKWLELPEEVLWNQVPSVWAGFVSQDQYSEFLGQPDILGLIEVRKASRRSSPIPIRTKDVDAGAVLIQAYVDLTFTSTGKVIADSTVELLGWADARTDYVTGDTPWWTDGDARTAVEKKPMDTLPLEDIMARAGVDQ